MNCRISTCSAMLHRSRPAVKRGGASRSKSRGIRNSGPATARDLAQEQPPRFETTFDVTSMLDVTVVDNNGQPITGLGRGDFNVKIDGQERRGLRAAWGRVGAKAEKHGGAPLAPVGRRLT